MFLLKHIQFLLLKMRSNFYVLRTIILYVKYKLIITISGKIIV